MPVKGQPMRGSGEKEFEIIRQERYEVAQLKKGKTIQGREKAITHREVVL
jgi:hypothetical protein